MKKILLLTAIFLSSCSSNTVKNDFNFSNEMSFEEFKTKLEEYAKNSPYPRIDD